MLNGPKSSPHNHNRTLHAFWAKPGHILLICFHAPTSNGWDRQSSSLWWMGCHFISAVVCIDKP